MEVEKSSGVRWMCHELRREDEEPVKRAGNLEVDGRTDRGRKNLAWKYMVKPESRIFR